MKHTERKTDTQAGRQTDRLAHRSEAYERKEDTQTDGKTQNQSDASICQIAENQEANEYQYFCLFLVSWAHLGIFDDFFCKLFFGPFSRFRYLGFPLSRRLGCI